MGQMFEYIFEDLAAIKRRQMQQQKFNRRILILALTAIAISEIRAYNERIKLKEYGQSKGE